MDSGWLSSMGHASIKKIDVGVAGVAGTSCSPTLGEKMGVAGLC